MLPLGTLVHISDEEFTDSLLPWIPPAYGKICYLGDAEDPEIKVQIFKPNDGCNAQHPSYPEQSGRWIKLPSLRRLTAAEQESQPWREFELAEEAAAAARAEALAASRPLLVDPPSGTRCRLKPGCGYLLTGKPNPRFHPDALTVAANADAERIVLTVSMEDGAKNTFGIFDSREMNPTAAYIEGGTIDGVSVGFGRNGFELLRGHHLTCLEWERDTLAYPPYDNLSAVHITAPDGRHGWVFLAELVEFAGRPG